MSPIWQTIIGAAAAVAGGVLAAWWQTSRADDIARRVRREERREQGLLALRAKVAEVRGRMNYLYQQAQAKPLTGQYHAAGQALAELRSEWDTSWSGVIPDEGIVKAYTAVALAAHDLFPGGPDAGMQFAGDESAAAKAGAFHPRSWTRARPGRRIGQGYRRGGRRAATSPASPHGQAAPFLREKWAHAAPLAVAPLTDGMTGNTPTDGWAGAIISRCRRSGSLRRRAGTASAGRLPATSWPPRPRSARSPKRGTPHGGMSARTTEVASWK